MSELRTVDLYFEGSTEQSIVDLCFRSLSRAKYCIYYVFEGSAEQRIAVTIFFADTGMH